MEAPIMVEVNELIERLNLISQVIDDKKTPLTTGSGDKNILIWTEIQAPPTPLQTV